MPRNSLSHRGGNQAPQLLELSAWSLFFVADRNVGDRIPLSEELGSSGDSFALDVSDLSTPGVKAMWPQWRSQQGQWCKWRRNLALSHLQEFQ